MLSVMLKVLLLLLYCRRIARLLRCVLTNCIISTYLKDSSKWLLILKTFANTNRE